MPIEQNIKNNNIEIRSDINNCIIKIQNKIKEIHGDSLDFLHPHVIDLAQDGHIGSHVDSKKFSGKLVCGLSLGSSRILRLVSYNGVDNDHNDKEVYINALKNPNIPILETILNPRSLYIFANKFRYEFAHEIIGEKSLFQSLLIPNEIINNIKYSRRISFMIRDTFK